MSVRIAGDGFSKVKRTPAKVTHAGGWTYAEEDAREARALAFRERLAKARMRVVTQVEPVVEVAVVTVPWTCRRKVKGCARRAARWRRG